VDKSDRIGCALFGCIGAAFLGIIVILVWILIVVHQEPDQPEDCVALPSTPGLQPWEPCVGHPSAEDSFEAPLTVADPRRVDVAEVFEAAMKLALRLEPSARLTTISANGPAIEGRYDLVASNMSIHFEYRCLETTKPPGQDRRQGQAYVFLQNGKVIARRLDVAAGLRDVYASFDIAPCGTVSAWRAVVGSGVPNDARATFVLSPGSGPFKGEPIWIVDVPGHPEFRRDVEARTCSRVMRDGRVVP